MNIRRLAAAVGAATLTFSLAPATATAAAASTLPGHSAAAEAEPTPVLPEEHTPTSIRRRDTDTLSLYRQAGLTPSKKVRGLIAQEPGATTDGAARGSYSRTAHDAGGNVIPPGLKSHVDQFCGGTGTDGARVQVMYVREADQPDRYPQVAPILRNEMRYIDDAFAVSSMETGGGKRVRWVHDGSCNLSVLDVVLPDGSITGSHGMTVAALDAAGYLTANRKYLAFADVPMGGLGGMACGQGALYSDTNPIDNLNDGRYPQVARVDLECWVTDDMYFAAPLHEVLHTLGAVMPEAPHGTAGFHCTDGAEVMCYNDGTAVMDPHVCGGQQHDIDCNNDDYFNTNPAPGSYLATHWNIASSPFLAPVPRLSDPPALRVSSDAANPETGDVVTFTANVTADTDVTWVTDTPHCENTGAPTTGTTFSIQCFDTSAPTVTAIASTAAGYTTTSVDTTVAYRQGPYPTLVIGAPTTVPADEQFTLTANVENAKAAWTYEWTNRSAAGCTIGGGTNTATLDVTCNDTMAGQFASFSVEATRTADATRIMDTVGVKITGSGTPEVVITGPESVSAGQQATFTAEVGNATNPRYQWYSARNWGESSSASVTVAVPAGATGTDTLYLTVTSATGERTSVEYTYTVTAGLAMTMNGPGALVSGETGTFTVTPSRATSDITWSASESACSIVRDASDPATARLTCAETYDGRVTVTAVARSGDDVVTRAKVVEVAPDVVEQALDTVSTLTVSSGNPTQVAVNLRERRSGTPVPNATVHLEFRPLDGDYTHVQEVTLDSSGAARFDIPATRAGYYRIAFPGDSNYEPSVSNQRRVYVFTTLSNARTKGGLKATLSDVAGQPLSGNNVTLQKRVAGSRKWVTVGSYRTNRLGQVGVRTNPRRSTDFRWHYRGDSSNRAATSRTVRLA